VVYPKGSSSPLRWNAAPVARIENVDDVQFVSDMIADLSAVAAVDLDRIYATGFSNGADMAYQVGCRLAGRVAAVGVVSGLGPEPPGGGNLARPVPLIAFFGAADPLAKGLSIPTWLIDLLLNVSVELKESSPPTETLIGQVAERNGCDGTPEPLPATGGVHGIRYTGCRDNAEVVLFTLEGGGHGWPGGPSIPLLGEASAEIDASKVMWTFFMEHPLGKSADE